MSAETKNPFKKLLASLKSAKAPKVSAPVPHLETDAPDRIVLEHYRSFHWSTRQQMFLTISLTINCAMLVAAMIFYTALSNAPTWEVQGTLTPTEAASQKFKISTEDLNADILFQFVALTLPALNQADEGGPGTLSKMLNGMVTGSIIERKRLAVEKQRDNYQKYGISKSVEITGILNPQEEKDSQGRTVRLALYIVGWQRTDIMRPVSGGEIHRREPYRARVVFEASEPNRTNTFPIFLVVLEERKGKDAVEWDKTMASPRGGADNGR
jgi:hypothetical protein